MNELEPLKDNLISKAFDFLGKITNKPLTELGELLEDKVKYFRFKNQINTLIKARKFLKEKNIEPKKIPFKTLFSLLEYSSWEEDQSMQTKWASLLANYATIESSNNVNACYVEILNQITPIEVKILDILYNAYYDKEPNFKNPPVFSKDKIFSFIGLNIDKDKQLVIIDNLFRLNLLQPTASYNSVLLGKFPVALRTYDAIEFTPLGLDFVKLCRVK
jgi:hypothetical protein